MPSDWLDYHAPSDIPELERMVRGSKAEIRFLAGGTDLLVNSFQENVGPAVLISLHNIAPLRELSLENGRIVIGGMLTLEELSAHDMLEKLAPVLCDAARQIASPVIRKSATIGGNLLCENRCSFYNQSAWWRQTAGYCLKCDGDTCLATGGTKSCFSRFVSDMAVVLCGLGAEVTLMTQEGEKKMPLSSLYTGTGLAPRVIQSGELLLNVSFAPPGDAITIFRKLRPRKSVDFSSLSLMTVVRKSGGVRLVAGGIDPGPVVHEAKAGEDLEKTIRDFLKKARTVDNDYYSRKYRREVLRVFIEENIRAAETGTKIS